MLINKFYSSRDKARLVSTWVIRELLNYFTFKSPTFVRNKNGNFELNRNISSELNSILFQQNAVIIKIRTKR